MSGKLAEKRGRFTKKCRRGGRWPSHLRGHAHQPSETRPANKDDDLLADVHPAFTKSIQGFARCRCKAEKEKREKEQVGQQKEKTAPNPNRSQS